MVGRVIAGDFPGGSIIPRMFGNVEIAWGFGKSMSLIGKVDKIEIVTKQNKRKLLSSTAWGAIGLATLGPLGALGGILLGGRRKEICFACSLNDGRQFLGVSDIITYQSIYGLSMLPKPKQDIKDTNTGKKALDKEKETFVKCSSCGKNVTTNSKFCSNCGKKIK